MRAYLSPCVRACLCVLRGVCVRQVYNERVYTLSVNCAREAAKHPSIRLFVEVSTAQVYEEGKVRRDCVASHIEA
jgi:hypothetical protein